MRFADRRVGIVDYQAGNIHSIESAFDHLGVQVTTLRSPDDIAGATHIFLPGVGAFGHCAAMLRGSGMTEGLASAALERNVPMLGICVGMQLLADVGEEMGAHAGLGWIGGTVRRIRADPPVVRVPHVGWNDVTFVEPFGDFAVGSSSDFYFDHSFAYHEPAHGSVVGHCSHGETFAAVIRRGSLVAAQFHPEKSQAAGMRFLANFLAMDPVAC